MVDLKVRNVGQKALHFRGKGGKDRTVPKTDDLAETLIPFCWDKAPAEPVVAAGEGVIYRVVKKYGMLIGKPEMEPQTPSVTLSPPACWSGE